MSKGILFTVVALLVATTVFAGTLNVVSSFLSRKFWRKGLEYAGGYLYTTSNYTDNTIHVYNTSGSLVSTIPTLAGSMGVEVSNAPKGHIWVCTYSSLVVLMTTAGSVVTSFSAPAAGYGISSDGTYLYYSSARSYMLYTMTTTGSVIRSFRQPGSFPGGVDYVAPGYLWLCDWPGATGTLYYVTTAGSVIESFPTPGAARPAGVTWDGTYVWYHHYTMAETGWCFRAEVISSGVAPASLGRIKSIFR